jgi:hypothetical protein
MVDHEKAVSAATTIAVNVATTGAIAALAVSNPLLAGALKVALMSGGALSDLFDPANKQLADWIRDEVSDAVFRRMPEVEQRITALELAGAQPKLADLANMVNTHARAWAKAADSKKRKLLEDAFVRSFDRELYESGLLNALWERLERLSYGDLFLLRELVEASARGNLQAVRRQHRLGDIDSIGAHHASMLLGAGLAVKNGTFSENVVPTDLGKRMRDLAWEQLPEPAAGDDSPEAKE